MKMMIMEPPSPSGSCPFQIFTSWDQKLARKKKKLFTKNLRSNSSDSGDGDRQQEEKREKEVKKRVWSVILYPVFSPQGGLREFGELSESKTKSTREEAAIAMKE